MRRLVFLVQRACRSNVEVRRRMRHSPRWLCRSDHLTRPDHSLVQLSPLGLFVFARMELQNWIMWIFIMTVTHNDVIPEWLIIIWWECILFNGCFLFLESFSVHHQINFNIWIWQSTSVHFFQIFRFENYDIELATGWNVSKRETNVAQLFAILYRGKCLWLMFIQTSSQKLLETSSQYRSVWLIIMSHNVICYEWWNRLSEGCLKFYEEDRDLSIMNLPFSGLD